MSLDAFQEQAHDEGEFIIDHPLGYFGGPEIQPYTSPSWSVLLLAIIPYISVYLNPCCLSGCWVLCSVVTYSAVSAYWRAEPVELDAFREQVHYESVFIIDPPLVYFGGPKIQSPLYHIPPSCFVLLLTTIPYISIYLNPCCLSGCWVLLFCCNSPPQRDLGPLMLIDQTP